MSNSEKFWDKTAEKYALSPVSDEKTYQRKLEETQACLQPDSRVLEFGCGTGSTAIHHAPRVQHIDAIDISTNMIEIARNKAQDAGISNATFSQGTLSGYQAAESTYDAVLGLNVMHLLADRQAEVHEVARILKPGGVFVSSTVCLGDSKLRFLVLLAPLFKALGLMPDLYVFSESQWVNELTEAGFEIETCWHNAKGSIAVFIIARKAPAAG